MALLARNRRVLLVVGLIVAVYNTSLLSLAQGLELQTPVAYLGMVPLLALGIAVVTHRRAGHERADDDREVDWILGTILLAIAVLILLLEPSRLSVMYWQWRIDLLSLPFFCAAAVTLVFGSHAMWRLRFALLFLFVAWPMPWMTLIGQALGADVTATLASLHAVAPALRVAGIAAGSDGSVFQLGAAGHSFQLSVSAPCAGSNSTLGFLLVGGAFASLLRGSWWRRLSWLLLGAMLTWILNVGRILVIFLAGDRFGEAVATNLLHPVLGAGLLVLGVLAMSALLPRFGLGFASASSRPTPDRQPPTAPRRPRLGRSLLVLALISVPLAVADAGFSRYSLVASQLGESRLTSFADRPAALSGWSRQWAARYDWSQQYFGTDSTWNRYLYSGLPGSSASARAVIVDAVLTTSLSSLQTYGLEQCYSFHGYAIANDHQLDLPGGVVALALTYRQPNQNSDWAAVEWIWPVQSGGAPRYERIVMLAPGGSAALAPLTVLAGKLVTVQASG